MFESYRAVFKSYRAMFKCYHAIFIERCCSVSLDILKLIMKAIARNVMQFLEQCQ